MNGELVNFGLFSFVPPLGDEVNFSLEIQTPEVPLIALGVSKKLGKKFWPNRQRYFGVWQMRKTKKGKVPILMKFYEPSNPQTVPQQANRNVFATAMSLWSNLTTTQKKVYNERAKKKNMYGSNLFVREYYQSL